ncbi:uncharacterized protein LOC106142843 [Amyelois transitella]|uniref:uncharacterized protein LOC106142843 n=1 Tax=Amyelois transitella TaxID=680683 RepID=UPI00067B4297|nr:uncharacterized protein LOC106142843 [Amyelois transitella]
MKHQQVSVDYWSMGKAMVVYGALTILCWVMLRLFNTVFTLPRRLRAQHENVQETLKELQKRFPDLNITEEELKEAEKELEALTKEEESAEIKDKEETSQIEDKKTI